MKELALPWFTTVHCGWIHNGQCTVRMYVGSNVCGVMSAVTNCSHEPSGNGSCKDCYALLIALVFNLFLATYIMHHSVYMYVCVCVCVCVC